MKHFFSIFIILFIFSGLFPVSTVVAEQNYFIVTAYYSPLPNQDYYSMGSYEAEVILNGQGIAGASGKKVFSGMLAAPQGYNFGTKIYLEGLGIGSVEDRGGAIVPAGQRGYSHDRIDVWMGYGDEGLRRAMYWGKRKVPGYIVKRSSATSINYYNNPAPIWASSMFKKQNQIPAVSTPVKLPNIFEISLESGSNKILVTKLQSLLVELEFLTDEFEEGEYDDATFEAVYDFQVDSGILASKDAPGAGRYGPKTRLKLKESYDNHLVEITKREEFLVQLQEFEKTAETQAQKYIVLLEKPIYGDISSEVRELQKTLAKLGYFPHKDTAIFGVKTQNALIEYQISEKLISQADDIGAGIFGPKTRGAMIENLSEIYLQQALDEEDLRDQYNLHTKALENELEGNLEEIIEEAVSMKSKTQNIYIGTSI